MKKLCCSVLVACTLLMSAGLFAPAMSDTRVRVNINIPLPPLVIPTPPPLIPIPGAYVYYPPDVNADIFFYHDRWFRPHHGKWYRAKNYNGPWHIVRHEHVPGVVRGIPHSYRSSSHGYARVSYDKVRRHYRDWERDRHWDRHERRQHRDRVMERDRRRDRHARREHRDKVMERDRRLEKHERGERRDRVMERDRRPEKHERREREDQQQNYKHNRKIR